MGDIYFRKSMYDEAVYCMTQAIKQENGPSFLYFDRGLVLSHIHRYESAIEDIDMFVLHGAVGVEPTAKLRALDLKARSLDVICDLEEASAVYSTTLALARQAKSLLALRLAVRTSVCYSRLGKTGKSLDVLFFNCIVPRYADKEEVFEWVEES